MDDLELYRNEFVNRLNGAFNSPIEEDETLTEETAGETLGSALSQVFSALGKKLGNEDMQKGAEKAGQQLGKQFSDAANKAISETDAAKAAEGILSAIRGVADTLEKGLQDAMKNSGNDNKDQQLNLSRWSEMDESEELEEGGEIQVGAAQGLLGSVSQEKVSDLIKNMSPEEYQKFTSGLQSDAIQVLFKSGKEGGGENDSVDTGSDSEQNSGDAGDAKAKLDDLDSQIQSGL